MRRPVPRVRRRFLRFFIPMNIYRREMPSALQAKRLGNKFQARGLIAQITSVRSGDRTCLHDPIEALLWRGGGGIRVDYRGGR